MQNLTWQDYVLVIVAGVVLVAVIVLSFSFLNKWRTERRVALEKEKKQDAFLQSLYVEVGKDSGTTIGTRLHNIDALLLDLNNKLVALAASLEAARILTEQKAKADALIIETSRRSADELAALVATLRERIGNIVSDQTDFQRFTDWRLNQRSAESLTVNTHTALVGERAKVEQMGVGAGIEQTAAQTAAMTPVIISVPAPPPGVDATTLIVKPAEVT